MLASQQIDRQYDVVVILHPGNWLDELTSNRWHYIRFFDQFVDVIVIQPTNDKTLRGTLRRDVRFTRTKILYTQSIRPVVDSSKKTARDISKNLTALGYRHPIYWLSTPLFWNVACGLKNGPVVFHATEDYLRLSEYNIHPASSFIRKCTRAAAEQSQVTLSVSSGVTQSLNRSTTVRNLVQSSNGFSENDYGERSLVQLIDLSVCANSIVYCGNINQRIDFLLLQKIATHFPERTLILVGPVHLNAADECSWRSILGYLNVRHINRCTVPEMNWLYRNSETGIIPYLHDPVIVESGFPLKALEMVGTGLPIVTTRMKSLERISPFIRTSENHSDFIQILETHTRINQQQDFAKSISDLSKFSYEIEIPRIWRVVLGSTFRTNFAVEIKKRARFSIISCLLDTRKQYKSKGFASVANVILGLFARSS